jgi:hypothetical protein
MNNIDPTENNNEEKPTKTPSKSTTSRNGIHRKSNGSISSKDPSSKTTCTIS